MKTGYKAGDSIPHGPDNCAKKALGLLPVTFLVGPWSQTVPCHQTPLHHKSTHINQSDIFISIHHIILYMVLRNTTTLTKKFLGELIFSLSVTNTIYHTRQDYSLKSLQVTAYRTRIEGIQTHIKDKLEFLCPYTLCQVDTNCAWISSGHTTIYGFTMAPEFFDDLYSIRQKRWLENHITWSAHWTDLVVLSKTSTKVM